MIDSIEAATRDALQSSTAEVWSALVQSPDNALMGVLGDIFVHLKAGTLIDMGSGRDQTIADMFIHAGVKRYIGVDTVPHTPRRRVPFTTYTHTNMRSFMDDPMLTRLFKSETFPSINFMFNAINGPVMASEELLDTLKNALPWLGDGDYIFGLNSPEVKAWLEKHAKHYDLRSAYVNPASPFFAFKRVLHV